MAKMPYRVDVHAHFLPPLYREACLNNGHVKPDGFSHVPEWSVEEHLKLMDQLNIRKSILSVSSPGTHLVYGNEELASQIARGVNEYAADVKKRYPDRFGYFASLPIPNVEVCLEEIRKSAEEGCDGFIMMSNGHGVYPGDQVLDPVFDELNRRKAVVFFHPSTPRCPCDPSDLQAGKTPVKATPFEGRLPNPMLEFFFDTARIIVNLFMSGTVQRCPDIKFIFSHCGGALPPMLSRFTTFSSMLPGDWTKVNEHEVREAFRKQIWFDTAGIPFPGQIRGLLEAGADHTRMFYGSDFPFTKMQGVEMLVKQMDDGVKGLFDEEEVEAIYHGNAEKLFGK